MQVKLATRTKSKNNTVHFKIPGRVARLSNGIPDISVEDLKIGTEDISFCIIVSATSLKLSDSLT